MKKLLKITALSLCTLLLAIQTASCSCAPEQGGKTVVSVVYDQTLDQLETLIENTYSDIDFQCEVNCAPGIVEYRIKEGKGPDLVVTSQPANQEGAQYVLPLGGQAFSNAYESTLMKSVSIDDIFYYLPLPGQYWGYIVNKSLFDGQNLSLPTTNDQLISSLLELKSKNVGISDEGFVFNYEGIDNVSVGNFLVACMVPEFLGKAEGVLWLDNLYRRESTFADSEWVNSFDLSNKLLDEGLMKRAQFTKQVNVPSYIPALAKGQISMLYGDSAYYQQVIEKNREFAAGGTAEEFEYVMLPFLCNGGTGGNNWTITAPSSYIGINRQVAEEGNEKKFDACKRVMNLISTVEGQKALMKDTYSSISYLKKNNISDFIPAGLEQSVASGYVYNIKFPGRVVEYLGDRGCTVFAEEKSAEEMENAIHDVLRAVDDYYLNGSSEVDYDMSTVGYLTTDLIERDYNVRRGETALGNLVADSVAECAGTPIAFVNGGGIRASLYEGNIFGGDLKVVCPYDNLIVVADVTGEVIWQMLENSVSRIDAPAIPGGRFLQVSGLKYKFNGSKPVGSRLLDVTLPDGQKINPSAKYRVAINDYMAGSRGYVGGNGDDYLMLNLFDQVQPLASGVTLITKTEYKYRDALKLYFANHADEVIEKKVEGRIVNVGA